MEYIGRVEGQEIIGSGWWSADDTLGNEDDFNGTRKL
ncbi:hypothetical protein SAMN05428981_1135 [Bacillus sp. OV194]|nr:hypothetical protein SAMN05428981_1135 [Bacillus sp. OV194]